MTDIPRLRAVLKDAGFDAAVIIGGVNRRYITGFPSTAGMVVVTEDTLAFFTDARYIEAAEAALPEAQVREIRAPGDYERFAGELLKDARVIGMEDEVISHATYEKYSKALDDRVQGLGTLLLDLRAAKTPEELSRIIQAQRIAERAFEEVLPLIRPGVTEREIAAELVYRMLRYGAEKTSFDPIVLCGAHTSVPHGATADCTIGNGDLVLMDFGCCYEGYCSDMTRTLAVGYAPEEVRRVYETVLRAQLAGIAKAAAGVPGRDIHHAAHQVITDAGYGPYFTHNFSHGIGLEIHEAPRMSLQSLEGICQGAVISAEPGIYLPGRFGIRIEDMLYIRSDGCDNLTNTPKELLIL